jgi:hypothetical protein
MYVGGESGSNGPPQPSLETLPTPAGGDTTITLDFLQTTDPNNLYPFLIALPSGNIFIGTCIFIYVFAQDLTSPQRVLQRGKNP